MKPLRVLGRCGCNFNLWCGAWQGFSEINSGDRPGSRREWGSGGRTDLSPAEAGWARSIQFCSPGLRLGLPSFARYAGWSRPSIPPFRPPGGRKVWGKLQPPIPPFRPLERTKRMGQPQASYSTLSSAGADEKDGATAGREQVAGFI